jgi:hypothetical protein
VLAAGALTDKAMLEDGVVVAMDAAILSNENSDLGLSTAAGAETEVVVAAGLLADANENGLALSPSDVVGLNENAGAADVVTAAVDAASDFSV